MGMRLANGLLAEFSGFVARSIGLSFPKERWPDLEKGLTSLCEHAGWGNEEDFARHIMSSALTKRQIEMLAGGLTVGETYFFREKNCLDAFQHLALSELIGRRRPAERWLRIWSAGCASGEEPYTIAMMLKMLLPDLQEWNISILATDINPHFLEKAMKGVYTKWSFRDVPEHILGRFFRKQGDLFEVHPEIRAMVSFAHLNLMTDDYPSLWNNTNAVDAIFCRNVLMYFSPENIQAVVRRFHDCLTPGGWFVVSQTELNDEYFRAFGKETHGGAVLFRKNGMSAGVQRREPRMKRRVAAPVAAPGAEEGRPVAKVKKSAATHRQVCKKTAQAGDMYARAEQAFDRGDYGPAAELAAGLLESNQDRTRARSLLARICANQGRLDDALRHIEDAIKGDSLKPASHYLHAAILKEKGLHQEATASLKKAIYLDADFALAYFALGNIALGAGNSGEAERQFNNALHLLRKRGPDEVLPESEGITAGRLVELIEAMKWRKQERAREQGPPAGERGTVP